MPPGGTQTFAIVMDDPDAPGGTWNHWVLFNLPADMLALPEGQPKTAQLPNGARQGLNTWGVIGYRGPCPPSGPAHNYRFVIYAVDRTLNLPAWTTRQQLETALSGHVLAESLLTAIYQSNADDNDDDGGEDDGGGGNGGGGY